MVTSDLFDWALFATIALAAAFLALLLLNSIASGSSEKKRSILLQSDDPTVFLFDDDGLIDATPEARRFLSAAPAGDNDWRRVLSLLSPRFPEIEEAINILPEVGTLSRTARDGELNLRAEMRGDLIRLTIVDPDQSGETANIDVQSLDVMERELETLRSIAEESHFLMWRQDSQNQVTWVNRAYLDLVERVKGKEATERWPPPALFDLVSHKSAGTIQATRLSLIDETSGRSRWYEVNAVSIGHDLLVTAVNADATVTAENQLREFMQTLTKTFAHLPIGLVVFDRARRLALFNPALTDLTGLPPDFLTARPTLFGFLDKLRERQMVPEPKDYKTWRSRIVELEAAAADGSYAETWALPNGQTYRVTGRPHPDGAVAFLFEDISAEISLTRRFRSELEIGQSAVDCFEDAIAVFSSSGTLVLSNAAYDELWSTVPEMSTSDTNVMQATRTWMATTVPTPVWGDFREFVDRTKDRSEWSADVRLKDGRPVLCRFLPAAGGATLVRFQIDPDMAIQSKDISREA